MKGTVPTNSDDDNDNRVFGAAGGRIKSVRARHADSISARNRGVFGRPHDSAQKGGARQAPLQGTIAHVVEGTRNRQGVEPVPACTCNGACGSPQIRDENHGVAHVQLA